MTGRVLGLALAVLAAITLGGCDDDASRGVEKVILAGKPFHLEVAADEPTRMKGLGGRTFIEPDGGMLFVFPRSEVISFVMRDCPIDIDIAFLDFAGGVVATYTMAAEEPRRDDEPVTGSVLTDRYEARLKRYSSRVPAQFAIELAAGTIERIGLKRGDRVELRTKALIQQAR